MIAPCLILTTKKRYHNIALVKISPLNFGLNSSLQIIKISGLNQSGSNFCQSSQKFSFFSSGMDSKVKIGLWCKADHKLIKLLKKFNHANLCIVNYFIIKSTAKQFSQIWEETGQNFFPKIEKKIWSRPNLFSPNLRKAAKSFPQI